MKNDKKKIGMVLIVTVMILLILLTIYGYINNQNRVENRLKTKLRTTAAEIFETDKWLNGEVTPDTYVATLDDLKNKLGKNISLFEKYNCNKKNTRVEFVVMQQTKAKQTNYKYNIILDCDF